MDTDESSQDKNEHDDDRLDIVETFKSFRLLNALSDLLMLPKDMLLEKSIRKEVRPYNIYFSLLVSAGISFILCVLIGEFSFLLCVGKVCPTFSSSMIKRILVSFLPDEFCPDAIPDEVLDALDSEVLVELIFRFHDFFVVVFPPS